MCFHLPNHPKFNKRVNKLNFTYSRIVNDDNEQNVIAAVSSWPTEPITKDKIQILL
jgi:hypothetical protein